MSDCCYGQLTVDFYDVTHGLWLRTLEPWRGTLEPLPLDHGPYTGHVYKKSVTSFIRVGMHSICESTTQKSLTCQLLSCCALCAAACGRSTRAPGTCNCTTPTSSSRRASGNCALNPCHTGASTLQRGVPRDPLSQCIARPRSAKQPGSDSQAQHHCSSKHLLSHTHTHAYAQDHMHVTTTPDAYMYNTASAAATEGWHQHDSLHPFPRPTPVMNTARPS